MLSDNTSQYINNDLNRPEHVKRGANHNLHAQDREIWSSEVNLDKEMKNIFYQFQSNDYSTKYIKKGISPKKDEGNKDEAKGSLVLPYVHVISERIRRTVTGYGLWIQT